MLARVRPVAYGWVLVEVMWTLSTLGTFVDAVHQGRGHVGANCDTMCP